MLDDHSICIAALNHCEDASNACAMDCLEESDPGPLLRCIRLDLDCAAMCRTVASALSRGTEMAAILSSVCASVCDRCAMECERHAHVHCRRCAEACRAAARACRP